MKLRQIIFGSPLETAAAEHQRLSGITALPVFASDALSSVAYATEEILLVLVIAGASVLHFSLPIAVIICTLLAIITASYVQVIHAYPQGGGAYVVAHENLGEWPGLVAAGALLIDYILTVAVSISAGAEAVTSAFPNLLPYKVLVCVLAVMLMTWANLRGIRESAALLSGPVYGFIAVMLALVAIGMWKYVHGHLGLAPSAATLHPVHKIGNIALTLLVLRAFSSGCTAMTGIEAVSNGVPAFKKPEWRSASMTLILLAVILATLFIGITMLAHFTKVAPMPTESVVSQIAHLTFGNGTMYYVVQAFTAVILVLAANTSFAGFPRLASILAKDGYLPRQLANLGDRLAFSNGIVALAVAAIFLLMLFQGSTHKLIPLYALGVFTSFVLCQVGMVRRWFTLQGPQWEVKAIVNGVGAVATSVALLVIIESKFVEGAWVVVVLMPVLLLMFRRVKTHYQAVSQQLSPRLAGMGAWLPWVHAFRPKVVVPVSKVHPGTLAALQFARAISDDITAVIVDLDPKATARVKLAWKALRFKEPLVVLESPYRSVIAPLMEYLETVDKREPERGLAVVVLPEFLPSKWWENVLHNQTALMLKAELLMRKGPRGDNRIVIDVPYRLKKAA